MIVARRRSPDGARAGFRARRAAWLALATLALVACQHPPRTPTLPAGAVRPLAPSATGVTHYRIDAEASEILVLVYRDGPLAALGHNHVIAVQQLGGDVFLSRDLTQSSVHLDIPVQALEVDEPQKRSLEGADFDSTLNSDAIAGTRAHMLGEQLLDAGRFPLIRLQSSEIHADGHGLQIRVAAQVRDFAGVFDVPVMLQQNADTLLAQGEFDLTHTQLGLTPYSVALGALRVAERMHVRYRLVARLVSPSGLQH